MEHALSTTCEQCGKALYRGLELPLVQLPAKRARKSADALPVAQPVQLPNPILHQPTEFFRKWAVRVQNNDRIKTSGKAFEIHPETVSSCIGIDIVDSVVVRQQQRKRHGKHRFSGGKGRNLLPQAAIQNDMEMGYQLATQAHPGARLGVALQYQVDFDQAGWLVYQ